MLQGGGLAPSWRKKCSGRLHRESVPGSWAGRKPGREWRGAGKRGGHRAGCRLSVLPASGHVLRAGAAARPPHTALYRKGLPSNPHCAGRFGQVSQCLCATPAPPTGCGRRPANKAARSQVGRTEPALPLSFSSRRTGFSQAGIYSRALQMQRTEHDRVTNFLRAPEPGGGNNRALCCQGGCLSPTTAFFRNYDIKDLITI